MKIILSKWYHCHKYLSAKFYADAQRVSSLPLVIIPTLHDAIQWDSYVGVYLNGLNRHHQPRSCTTELWELNLLSEVQTCTDYMKRTLYSVKAKEPLFRFWRNDHSKKTINRIKRNIQLYLEGTWVNECHKYINENVKISWPKTLCQMREKWIVATMKFFFKLSRTNNVEVWREIQSTILSLKPELLLLFENKLFCNFRHKCCSHCNISVTIFRLSFSSLTSFFRLLNQLNLPYSTASLLLSCLKLSLQS